MTASVPEVVKVPSRSSPWPTFAMTAGAAFLGVLDGTVAAAAFPALRASFPDVTPADLGVGGARANAARQMGGVALAVLLVGRADAAFAEFRYAFLLLAGLGVATAILGWRVLDPVPSQDGRAEALT